MAERGGSRSSLVVVRTPLLPWRTLLDWPREEEAARAFLRRLVDQPEVRETLFIGARQLFDQLDAWRDDPTSERGQKLEQTLVRYLARMSTRATPYSQFASVGLATIGSPTRLSVAPTEGVRRRVAPSMRFMVNLVGRFETAPQVRRAVAWFPNPTLTGRPLAEFLVATNERARVVHHVQQVEVSPALDRLLERARGGALQEELAALLVDDEVSLEEALAFVDEVARAQILVSELRVPVTGLAPERVVLEQLRARGLEAEAETIASFCRASEALEQAPIGQLAVSQLDALTKRGQEFLGPELIAEVEDVVAIDLVRSAANVQVPKQLIDETVEVLEWVQTLAPSAPLFLQPMLDAFIERYEEREVPLLEALDPLRGLPSPREAAPAIVSQVPLGGNAERQELKEDAPPRWLLDQWVDAVRAGRRELVLEVPRGVERAALRDTAVWLRLEAADEAAVERGDYRVLLGGSGPLLGGVARFGRSVDGLPEAVARLVAAEETKWPNDVLAEIVHLPSGYSDNVVTRPAWRRYEIPVVGRSSLPPDRQLPLSDLVISARGGEFVVRSRRLGKRVRPVAATAFNYEIARESRAFRFLSGLTDEKVRTQLPLGDLVQSTWLPRVRVGRVVLSAERWKLGVDQRASVKAAKASARGAEVQRLRERFQWPRFVMSGAEASDTQLVIDLDNPMLVDSFAHQLATLPEPLIVRELFVGDGPALGGPAGPFVHEFVVPTVSTSPVSAVELEPLVEAPTEARTFPPGSAWAFLKCYGAPEVTERWLLERAGPVLEQAVEAGAVDGWFFLHYGDPKSHLRLRLHGPRANALASQLLVEAGAWVARGLAKVEWSTYEREVERYGGQQGIEVCERGFFHDSAFALEVLPFLPTGDERLMTLIAAIDQTFTAFEVELEPRSRLVDGLRRGYASEFGVGQPQENMLSAVGRTLRTSIDDLLGGKGALAERLGPALERRSKALAPVGVQLRALQRDGLLSRPLSSIVASLTHMLATRLLNQAVRRSELLAYDLLSRRYRSLAARQPKRPATK